MTTPTAALAMPAPAGALARVGRAARQQAVVGAGQAAAGIGNLAFVAVAARLLDQRGFGQVAAFVALHTAMHVPGAGLAAAMALHPERAARLARRCAAVGVAVGAALAVATPAVASLTGLPRPMVLALAAAAPAAPLLGLRRGVAYGRRLHGAVVLSLVSEPFARCTLGLALAASLGAEAAVWGVVAGGWLALLSLEDAGRAPVATGRGSAGHLAWGPAVAFVLATVLQHQDVVLANRLLDGADAGAFAALSAVGGTVAFATATLPMVLLPAAAGGERDGSAVALALAGGIGGAAALLAAVAPGSLLRVVVGPGYAAAQPYVLPYVGAMAALGTTRVLAAHRCALGSGRRVATTLAVVAAGHLLALVLVGRSIGAVVAVSATALVVSTAALAIPVPVRPAAAHAARRPWWRRATDLDAPLLLALAAVATAIRLATNRSIWIDEATSVAQARLPFGAMLADLGHTDVHPPLHHILLWITTRIAGTSEVAVRAPSVLVGVLTIPAAYGLARELFDRRTARLAAALVVPAPFLVWYAQEARMYSLFMLAGVCSVWMQVAALRRGHPAAYLGWALASAAMVWTQWFGVLPVAVQFAAGLAVVLQRRSAGLKRPLLLLGGTVVVLGVALAPLVPLLLEQLASYGERGAGLTNAPSVAGIDAAGVERSSITVYAVIANLLWALTGYHADAVMAQLGAVWPLGMLAALLGLGRRVSAETKVLAAVAVLPALALLAIGTRKRDLFELRYFALLAPLLLVLVARAATTLAKGRVALALATALLLGASVAGLVDQQVNGANPRLFDFRGAVADITADAGDDAAVALEPAYLETVTGYYGPELRTTSVRALDIDDIGPDGIDVVVAARLVGSEEASGMVGEVLFELEERFGAPARIERPNVIIWRFR